MENKNKMPKPGGDKTLPVRNKILILIAGCVLAVAVGLGIYNSPENRLNRQLELGQKYLEEGNYEQAVVAFNQAIEIDDRCLEAYEGGLEARLHMDDAEGLRTFYEDALEVSRSLTEDELTANVGYVAADKVYEEDVLKILELSTEGLYRIGENDELIAGMSGHLTDHLEKLMEEERYEEVKELIEKYRKYPLEVDWDGILARIEEVERLKAENDAFMKKVYDCLAAEDYETMVEISHSEEVAAMVARLETESYIYLPDSEASGTGVGIYTYEEQDDEASYGPGYYFYYGSYENGQRTGRGSSFASRSHWENTFYKIFHGEWKNDAPNGYGEESNYSKSYNTSAEYYSTKRGNLIDGLWDGQVDYETTYSSNQLTYNCSWIAEKGIPTEDKTEEFLEESYGVTEETIFGKNDEYKELGDMVYTYAIVERNGYEYSIWYICKKGERIGTIGYGDDKGD